MAYNVISINNNASAAAITPTNSGVVADIINRGQSGNVNGLTQSFNQHTSKISIGDYIPVSSVITNNVGQSVLVIINNAV